MAGLAPVVTVPAASDQRTVRVREVELPSAGRARWRSGKYEWPPSVSRSNA